MKTNQTFISVSIPTDYTHERGNELEQARQQIELASFYLQSLFNSIKHSAANLESRFDGQGQEFCNDLRNLSDIGYSVSGSIFASLSVFETDAQLTTETSTNTDAASEIREPQTALTIAEMISKLITGKDVPAPISDGISQVMIDFHNEHVDQTEFINENYSPVFINRLINAYTGDDDE